EKVRSSLPVATSHSLSALSPPPDSTVRLSGENATEFTPCECPVKVRRDWPPPPVGCCARAPSGHDAAAPLSRVMNSRRLMDSSAGQITSSRILERNMFCASQRHLGRSRSWAARGGFATSMDFQSDRQCNSDCDHGNRNQRSVPQPGNRNHQGCEHEHRDQRYQRSASAQDVADQRNDVRDHYEWIEDQQEPDEH